MLAKGQLDDAVSCSPRAIELSRTTPAPGRHLDDPRRDGRLAHALELARLHPGEYVRVVRGDAGREVVGAVAGFVTIGLIAYNLSIRPLYLSRRPRPVQEEQGTLGVFLGRLLGRPFLE
jgi:hypothetical protein